MGFRRYPARLSWPLTLLLALCFVPFTLTAQSTHVADDLVVHHASGAVRINVRDTWLVPAPGMDVSLPATVSTGADGAITLMQGQTTISIAANTAVELLAGPDSGKVLQKAIQNRGSAFYDIAPRESNRFQVDTPYLVAVVKGTQFDVTVAAEFASVALFEGRLRIEAPEVGDVVDLREGQIARRHKNDRRITVINMDDGETASRGGSLSPASGGDSSPPEDGAGTVAGSSNGGSDDDPTSGLTAGGIDPATGIDDGTIDIDVTGDIVGSTVTGEPDVNLASGGGKIETGIETGAGISGLTVEAGLGAGVDLGNGTLDVGVDAGADLLGATADVGADVSADLGSGAVDLGADAGVDVGAATVDAGVDAGTDLGTGTIDVDVDAGAELVGAAADVGADVGADLGSGTVDAGVDVGSDLVDTAVDAAVDVGGGTVEVDVAVGGIDLDLGLGGEGGLVDLGLDPIDDAEGDTSSDSADDDTDTGLPDLRNLFGR